MLLLLFAAPPAGLTWPAELPQYVLADGWKGGDPGNVIRSDVASGTAIERLRDRYTGRSYDVQVPLSFDQVLVFEKWYDDSAAGRWFVGPHPFDPATRPAVQLRIVRGKYSIVPVDRHRFRLSMTLETKTR